MTPIPTRKSLTKTAKPSSKSAKSPAVKAAKKSTPKAKAAPVKPKKAVSAKAKPAPKKAPAAKPAPKKAPAAKKAAPLTGTAGLVKRITAVLDTNKAESITTLALSDQCSFADYMIVASGRAPRHVAALADYVTDLLKKEGNPPLSVEGKETGDWVLIDAGDVIVHIFRPEVRMFYNIEKMWTLPPAATRR